MSVTLAEAQARLKELIEKLAPGEEIVIIENEQRVARLVAERPVSAQRPGPGLCRQMVTIVADDKEHLNDFVEYMP